MATCDKAMKVVAEGAYRKAFTQTSELGKDA